MRKEWRERARENGLSAVPKEKRARRAARELEGEKLERDRVWRGK